MAGGIGVRAAVAAGSFYPGSGRTLAADVDALLVAGRQRAAMEPAGLRLRGIVVPHAGYAYSGPIAATAYALLAATEHHPPRCIVILGPSHLVPLDGWAVPTHAAWSTPLGDVAIDDERREMAVGLGAALDDRPHRSEHSIEVQLPFLQRACPGTAVLPVAVGGVVPDGVAASVGRMLADGTLLVVSTDLSHDHDAVTARRLDERTATAIQRLDEASLRAEDACGHWPLRVALAWARMGGIVIDRLDLRTSADTAGDPHRVVGYGAFAMRSG